MDPSILWPTIVGLDECSIRALYLAQSQRNSPNLAFDHRRVRLAPSGLKLHSVSVSVSSSVWESAILEHLRFDLAEVVDVVDAGYVRCLRAKALGELRSMLSNVSARAASERISSRSSAGVERL